MKQLLGIGKRGPAGTTGTAARSRVEEPVSHDRGSPKTAEGHDFIEKRADLWGDPGSFEKIVVPAPITALTEHGDRHEGGQRRDVQTPTATVRCRGSRNVVRISAITASPIQTRRPALGVSLAVFMGRR